MLSTASPPRSSAEHVASTRLRAGANIVSFFLELLQMTSSPAKDFAS